MKTFATAIDKYQIQLKKSSAIAKISISVREVIPEIFNPFIYFNILSFLNFVMTKWFCRVTYFVKIFLS